MTTNAGSESAAAVPGFTSSGNTANEERTQKALSAFLRPEFINRVDEVITFRSLDEDDFVKIASLMLGQLKEALAERAIAFAFTDEAAALIAHEAFSVKFGARNMRRYIQTHVEDPLASLVIGARSNKISSAVLSVKNGVLSVDSPDSGNGDK